MRSEAVRSDVPLLIHDDDVATIDVREVVCPDRPLCHPVKDGTVVWKDRDHVTATWYVDHRPAIWRRLVRTGLIG